MAAQRTTTKLSSAAPRARLPVWGVHIAMTERRNGHSKRLSRELWFHYLPRTIRKAALRLGASRRCIS